ncbi:MAG: CDP-diacylglycerol--serine O-phosphatidyltransferase [Bacteroidales bacterium]|nr:CDP-diacylglycerol--serine O-phosphatidyltransferase [Bacteroidales bacterium]
MRIKTHIPNFITLLNLLSGILSVYFSLTGDVRLAGLLIFVAALFDFFDGFAARLLNAKTPIGADLDSLADVVSFGVAPGFILFQMLRYSLGQDFLPVENPGYLPFVAFAIPLFGALRLAKFNVDDEQSDSFKGLPIPAQAIVVASFPLIVLHCFAGSQNLYLTLLTNPWFLTGSGLLLSVLMVSNLPMFALKFKGAGWLANQTPYVFLLLALVLLALLRVPAIPLIVLLYLLVSVFQAVRK